MEILQSHVGLVALWGAAILASLWVVGPLLLFPSPLRSAAIEVRDDPREAEPRKREPEYERRFAELRARGFQPVGKTTESVRFFTPLHWRWVANGTRWLASPDRKLYVGISRIGDRPQRLNAATIFEGSGMLMTSTTPANFAADLGERYRRVEIGQQGPDELITEHDRNVGDFSREVGLHAHAATLAQIAAELAVITKPYIVRRRLAKLYVPAMVFLLPLQSLVPMIHRGRVPPWLPPTSLCLLATLFALARVLVLPEFRRVPRRLALAGMLGYGLLLPQLLSMLMRLKPPHR